MWAENSEVYELPGFRGETFHPFCEDYEQIEKDIARFQKEGLPCVGPKTWRFIVKDVSLFSELDKAASFQCTKEAYKNRLEGYLRGWKEFGYRAFRTPLDTRLLSDYQRYMQARVDFCNWTSTIFAILYRMSSLDFIA